MKGLRTPMTPPPRKRGAFGASRRVAWTVGFALLITSAFAFGPVNGNQAAACVDPTATQNEATGQATPHVAPVARLATPLDLHDDWPVVSETEQIRLDALGRSFKTTLSVRAAPTKAQAASIPGIIFGPSVALACQGPLGDIAPILTAYSYDGAFQQHYQLFFHRLLNNSGQEAVYRNYQTNVWWTRNYSDYDVYQNQAQNCWQMAVGNDCNDNVTSLGHDPICSQLPFSPGVGWPGATGDSYTYVYTWPMDSWAYMWRPNMESPFNWSFTMTTQWSVNGVYVDTISDSYTTPIR
jgi:hypothetical protein